MSYYLIILTSTLSLSTILPNKSSPKVPAQQLQLQYRGHLVAAEAVAEAPEDEEVQEVAVDDNKLSDSCFLFKLK